MNTPLMINTSQQSAKSVKQLLRQAVRSLRTNKFQDAIKFVDSILVRHPEHERANALKFTTFYMSKQMEKARMVGAKAAALNPYSDYILNNQACLELGVGNALAAQQLLNTLIDNKGDNSQWLYNLGLAEAQLGNFHQAIDKFNRVLDLQPDYHKAILQKASVELKLGEHEAAMQSFNLLRLTAPSQSAVIASLLHHGVRFNQFDHESLKQEIDIWGEIFIPKNKVYDNPTIEKSQNLQIGFIIGSTIQNEWKHIVRPVINEIANLGHKITVYWHQSGILPISNSKNIEIINCRPLKDADFARLCREKGNQILIDVGGMHSQTRERALGLQLATKQYAWLVHAGTFSSSRISSLDHKLGNYSFAIELEETEKKSTLELEKNAITAHGCHLGISWNTSRIWSEILKKSKKNLILDVQSAPIKEQLLNRFKELGVPENKIIFSDKLSYYPDQLVLENIDYNALTSTCLALNSGAKVITLKGELFPAQRTSLLLDKLGYKDWICSDEYQYIDLAVKISKSRKKNKDIKSVIKNSDFSNIQKFANHFIEAL